MSKPRKSRKALAFDSAMDLADEIATGKIDPAELERQAVAECRRLFGTVAGPDDPLWSMHCEIFHRVLEIGGAVSADELGEWVAVYRTAEVAQAAEVEGVEAEVVLPGAAEGATAGDGGAGGIHGDVPLEVEVDTLEADY